MWGRALKIAHVAGFDIKIDASWLLIAALIVWSLSTSYFAQRLPAMAMEERLLLAVIAMLGLFGSLVLHELAHAIVARRLGVPTAGITLFLFGGVAELQAEPATAGDEFKIASVGPLASLILAALFWTATQLVGGQAGTDMATALLRYLAMINLMLAVFNIIPAFPLDGGRVFRALLWWRSGNRLAATRQAVAVSSMFSWLLIGVGLLSVFTGQVAGGLWPILVGLFLLAVARSTLATMEAEGALGGRLIVELMTQDPIVANPDLTLESLANDVFLDNAISFAPVVEGGVLLGSIDIPMMGRIDRENWATTTVEDVFETMTAATALHPKISAQQLMERIAHSGRRKFLVVDDERLVGVVTLSDLTRYLAVSKDLGNHLPSRKASSHLPNCQPGHRGK